MGSLTSAYTTRDSIADALEAGLTIVAVIPCFNVEKSGPAWLPGSQIMFGRRC